MSTVEEIQYSIESLPEEEYARLRQWFSERDWEKWDKQIEVDSESRKLDFLVKEAYDEKAKGKLKDTEWARVSEDDRAIKIETDKLEAVIPKKNPKHWMTGIEKGSFLDKTTGFREVGDGLMVVDWLMEAGNDENYGNQVIAPDGHGVGRYTWHENETEPDSASLTLEPSVVYEAWCSQRPGNIIVMIEENHGKPVKASESFSAAHIVGYFDTIEDMHKVYDLYKGHTALTADASGWRLVR